MGRVTINISDTPKGAVVAEDVFDERGTFLLSKDSTTNPYIIKKLSEYGVKKIAVYDGSEAKDVKTYIDKDLSSNEFIGEYKSHVGEMKEIMTNLATGKKVDLPQLEQMTNSVFSKMHSYFSIVECLNELRTADDYTYTHSVNVAIYGMLMAKWLKLSDNKIKDVVLAGLLHDIGKARIPDSIVKKRGSLEKDEFEFMKKHSVIGFNISQDIKGLNDEIRDVILMHHERDDGKGYPNGVTGDELSLYTKIISVADVYDAMTSERVYKKRSTPFDTFKEFQLEGFGHFDPKIMLTFLTNIATYYLGSKVRLDNQEIGEIVYLPPLNMSTPVVKVGEKYIDLYWEPDCRIIEML